MSLRCVSLALDLFPTPLRSHSLGACTPQDWLGGVISLGRYATLPASLPDTRYFSYWSSTKALLRAACASAGLAPRIKSLGQPRSTCTWNSQSAAVLSTPTLSLSHTNTHAHTASWSQPSSSDDSGALVLVGVRPIPQTRALEALRARVRAIEDEVATSRAEAEAEAAAAAAANDAEGGEGGDSGAGGFDWMSGAASPSQAADSDDMPSLEDEQGEALLRAELHQDLITEAILPLYCGLRLPRQPPLGDLELEEGQEPPTPASAALGAVRAAVASAECVTSGIPLAVLLRFSPAPHDAQRLFRLFVKACDLPLAALPSHVLFDAGRIVHRPARNWLAARVREADAEAQAAAERMELAQRMAEEWDAEGGDGGDSMFTDGGDGDGDEGAGGGTGGGGGGGGPKVTTHNWDEMMEKMGLGDAGAEGKRAADDDAWFASTPHGQKAQRAKQRAAEGGDGGSAWPGSRLVSRFDSLAAGAKDKLAAHNGARSGDGDSSGVFAALDTDTPASSEGDLSFPSLRGGGGGGLDDGAPATGRRLLGLVTSSTPLNRQTALAAAASSGDKTATARLKAIRHSTPRPRDNGWAAQEVSWWAAWQYHHHHVHLASPRSPTYVCACV